MTSPIVGAGSWWARRSIRDKLAIPFVLVIAAMSIFAYLYFPSAMEQREMEALELRGESVAKVVSFGVRAAVVFEDAATMEALLESVVRAGDVVYAQLTGPDGEVLAEAVTPALQRSHDESLGAGSAMTRVSVPVIHEGAPVAEVMILLSRVDMRRSVMEMQKAAQVVALLMFLVGALSLIVVSRFVTRPLFSIFDTAERISAGDLSRRVVVQTHDEVGQLSQSFNAMVDRLEASKDELKDMNRNLEDRVHERTARWREEQSQRLRLEEEKEELEAFFTEIMDAIPLEVTVHGPDRTFLYVNPAAEPSPTRRQKMVGRTPGDAGEADRVGVPAFERREEAVGRAIRTGCLVSIEERVADGTPDERYFLRVYSPMLGTGGEVTKIVGYGVDITNRRAAEEALRESEEKLRQSQKMEAVGRLAGGIAHDFNNLLTVISGHTELLLFEVPEDSDAERELQQIGRAADRAATLTRQLLAFSRKQVLQPRRLDPNDAIRGVEKMLTRLIGEHIDLVTQLDPDIGDVKADPGQFEQVLMNLAVNAADAMPGGGRLMIETAHTAASHEPPHIRDELVDGTYVVVYVRDTGTGIADAVQAKIFEPFFTTKGVGKGTGLGLSTVYGIINQTGGNIFVDSTPGVGTTFKVFLPTLPEPGADGPSAQNNTAQVAGGSETILLVEDEPMVRELTRTLLLRAGYHVLAAGGSHEALGIVRNHSGPIDLLFTDVVMPGMPGHELAVKVVELRESVKVLYMSGYTDDALLDRGVLADGVVLLQKPFSGDRALKVTRAVLDGTLGDALIHTE
jgi:signal transduction histidine kinase/ActR/RegA family two-component response regulator